VTPLLSATPVPDAAERILLYRIAREATFEDEPTHQALPSEQEKMKKLTGLSGAAFDTEYATAHDPDVKSFAEATLPTLQSHLMMAEALPGAGGSPGTGTAGQ
jgi:hypothetical protein